MRMLWPGLGYAALAIFYAMMAISVYRRVVQPRYKVSEAEKRSIEAAQREARKLKKLEDELNLPDDHIAAIMKLRREILAIEATEAAATSLTTPPQMRD